MARSIGSLDGPAKALWNAYVKVICFHFGAGTCADFKTVTNIQVIFGGLHTAEILQYNKTYLYSLFKSHKSLRTFGQLSGL